MMKASPFLRWGGAAALAAACAPLASAHPGHGPMGFSSGLIHPLTGWDHLLAMLAVGLWAAQLGGRARWALPAAFVGSMVAGAAIGLGGHAPPATEAWILASVFILGLAVAGGARVPLGAGLPLVAAAGFFHGAAHGAEMPAGAPAASFLAGMALATALLHCAGVAAGRRALQFRPVLVRCAGAAILAAGLALSFFR